MRHARPNLDETIKRSYEAWRENWDSDFAPLLHYKVSFECDEKGFSDAVCVVVSRKVDALCATYRHSDCPQAVLEFNCTYEVWCSLFESFKGVPAVSRSYRQYELNANEGCK